MKYEYLIRNREEMSLGEYHFGGRSGRSSLAKNMNELGAEGWRLVTVVDGLYHFEREILQKHEVVVSQIGGKDFIVAEHGQKLRRGKDYITAEAAHKLRKCADPNIDASNWTSNPGIDEI
jgi:hypothetical protein